MSYCFSSLQQAKDIVEELDDNELESLNAYISARLQASREEQIGVDTIRENAVDVIFRMLPVRLSALRRELNCQTEFQKDVLNEIIEDLRREGRVVRTDATLSLPPYHALPRAEAIKRTLTDVISLGRLFTPASLAHELSDHEVHPELHATTEEAGEVVASLMASEYITTNSRGWIVRA